MEPLVSVIVPVYNVERYLKRCLDSLVNQTVTNCEIILINDGSTDGSLNICEDFAKFDKRIKLLSQENKGVSAARNSGIKHSSGIYIMFVDADDWCDIDMLEFMLNPVQNMKADIFMCDYYINDQPRTSSILDDAIHEIEQNDAVRQCLNKKEIVFGTTLWNKIFRRQIVEQIGMFDETITLGEDMDFLIRYLLESNLIYYSMKPKYHYFSRVDSAVASIESKHLSVIPAHIKILLYVRGNNELTDLVKERMVDSVFVLLRMAMNRRITDKTIIIPLQEVLRLYPSVTFESRQNLKSRILYKLIATSYNRYKLITLMKRGKRIEKSGRHNNI